MKRNYLSIIFIVLVLLALLFGCVDNPNKNVNKTFDIPDISSEGKTYLCCGGKSNYKIVVPKNALPAVVTASKELQKYLSQITSFDYPITKDNEKEHEYEIILGATTRDTDEIKKLKEDLGSEGYLIKWEGKKLFISGGDEESTYGRGTLYGVYDFLRSLGCGFYAKDTEIVPEKKEIVLDITEPPIKEVPAFEYRDLFWTNSYDEELSAKLHINGCLMSGSDGRIISKEYGSGVYYAGPKFVHTFDYLIPAEEYFGSHPEYFSLVNGKRSSELYKRQLCLTNEDVYAIVRDMVKSWLDENPDAKIVSISQNDGLVGETYCTCPNCASVDSSEGSHAGTLIRFVNRLAEELENDYPDVSFDTLAYQYSLTPPKTKPRDNVIVRYCTGGCTSHSVDACGSNSGIKNNVLSWSRKCNRIYIWNYTTNFADYLCPMMNFRSIADDIRFFKENSVSGIFQQGMYQEGENGEFGELRCYVMARLMWNPDEDVDALIDEFMKAYYGDAGELIKEYVDILSTQLKKAQSHVGITNSAKSVYGKIIKDYQWERIEQIWKEAAEIVKNDKKALYHVEKSCISYRSVKMKLKLFEFADGDNKETERFYADCRRLGIKMLSEGAAVPAGQ